MRYPGATIVLAFRRCQRSSESLSSNKSIVYISRVILNDKQTAVIPEVERRSLRIQTNVSYQHRKKPLFASICFPLLMSSCLFV